MLDETNFPKPQRSFKLTTVAQLLDCSLPTVYRMIASEKMKAFQLGSDKRVTESEILRIQSGEINND